MRLWTAYVCSNSFLSLKSSSASQKTCVVVPLLEDDSGSCNYSSNCLRNKYYRSAMKALHLCNLRWSLKERLKHISRAPLATYSQITDHIAPFMNGDRGRFSHRGGGSRNVTIALNQLELYRIDLKYVQYSTIIVSRSTATAMFLEPPPRCEISNPNIPSNLFLCSRIGADNANANASYQVSESIDANTLDTHCGVRVFRTLVSGDGAW